MVVSASVMGVASTVEEAEGNEGPCKHLGCFFAGLVVIVSDVVLFLFPPVALLELENVVSVVEEIIVSYRFPVVAAP